MLEIPWVFNCFAEPISIFDMAPVVAHSRIENIVQGVFPQKEIADNSHALCILVVYPEVAQIGYCVDRLFHFC